MGENGDAGDGIVPEEEGGRDNMSGESGDGGREGAMGQVYS